MLEIKQQLIQLSLTQVNDRIATIGKALDEIQKALTSETKSSAGDKFETTRAMLHGDQDRYTGQLNNAKSLRNQLNLIDINSKQEAVKGALIKTDKFNYFLAVGIGKLKIGNEIYLVISPSSPIGKIMLGKNINDVIVFNGVTQQIVSIH